MKNGYSDDFTKEMVRFRESTVGDPLRRRDAVRLGSMLGLFLQENGLTGEWRRHRIYSAWDRASGAAACTLTRNFSKGVLYCGLSSSMVRNQLYFQKDLILKEINRLLREDEMFGMPKDGSDPVKALVLK